MGLFKSFIKNAVEGLFTNEPEVEEPDLTEEDLNYEFDESDYDFDEIRSTTSDEEFRTLGMLVDRTIEENEGYISDDDREFLHEEAASCGLTYEEFDQLLNSRLQELQEAIEAGYDRHDVYRTKSVFRRCPNCGEVNSAGNTYCWYCGYQLRYRTASFILGSLMMMGAVGGDARSLHRRHVSNVVKKANAGRKNAKQLGKRSIEKRKSATTARVASSPRKIAAQNSAARRASTGSRSTPPPISGARTTRTSSARSSMFGSSSSSSSSASKRTSMFGSSSSSSSSSVKKAKKSSSGGLFGGSSSSKKSSKKSSGMGLLGGGKRRRR